MRSTVLGAMVVVLLVMTAAALAASNKLVGPIKDDANGKVSMKIVVKNGDPVKAKDVKVSNLDYECQDGTTGERTFKFPKIAIQQQAVGSPLPYAFGKSVKSGDSTYTITGETAKGKKVEGEVTLRIENPGNLCTSENLPGDTSENGLYTAK